MMCAVLSGWALVQVILASVSLARHAAGSVWESEFEFDTRGLSVFRLLAHLYLVRALSTTTRHAFCATRRPPCPLRATRRALRAQDMLCNPRLSALYLHVLPSPSALRLRTHARTR
jgi:hypothetical protein